MIAEAVAAVALPFGPVAESVTQRSAIISFRTAAREHAFVILQNGARIDAGTGVDHVARLTRLTPGMHYTDTVGADSGALAKGTFRSAPVRAGRFTFAVVGDFGSGTGNETAVASMIESWHPDFVLTVGDNAYPLGSPWLLDRDIFGPYAAVIRLSPHRRAQRERRHPHRDDLRLALPEEHRPLGDDRRQPARPLPLRPRDD